MLEKYSSEYDYFEDMFSVLFQLYFLKIIQKKYQLIDWRKHHDYYEILIDINTVLITILSNHIVTTHEIPLTSLKLT